MRDAIVQRRLEMSKALQVVSKGIDGCGCGSEKEINDDMEDIDEREVVGKDKEDVMVENGLAAISNTISSTTTTAVASDLNADTGGIVNDSTTFFIGEGAITSIKMTTMPGTATEHVHHKGTFTEVDEDDHEYLHVHDVPRPPPVLPFPTKEPQYDPDIEIQVEHVGNHADSGATVPVRNAEDDDKKPLSNLNLCEKCKRQVKLAECLEEAVMDMNEIVRAMNDYIIECALQIKILEQSKNKKKRNCKKKKERNSGVDRTGLSDANNKDHDDDENEGCSVERHSRGWVRG